MKYDSIVVIGLPYAGKSTHCALLAKRPDFFHFSTGEMFRNLNNSTPAGAKVKALIDSGKLVNDDGLVMSLTKETLERAIANNNYNPKFQQLLLDGLPRTRLQVPLVAEIANITLCLYLEGGSTAELIQRAQRRYQKEGRTDDSDLKKIESRINSFFIQTYPIIDFYEHHGIKVVRVNSRGRADVSSEQLETRIQEINQEILKKILPIKQINKSNLSL